jgi:hypothetical protein
MKLLKLANQPFYLVTPQDNRNEGKDRPTFNLPISRCILLHSAYAFRFSRPWFRLLTR